MLFSTLTVACAVEPSSVPQSKRTKLGQYLTSQEAADILAKNAPKTLFLDVRPPSEVAFVGMPTLADANVPYMIDSERSTFKLESNPDFLP